MGLWKRCLFSEVLISRCGVDVVGALVEGKKKVGGRIVGAPPIPTAIGEKKKKKGSRKLL